MAELNPAQRNTPLVTEECEGEITVTDPRHPLFGRKLRLAGLAYLPGHVRHCQVEIRPGHLGYVPFAATHLSREPAGAAAVLSAAAVADLVAAFQAVGFAGKARRRGHAHCSESADARNESPRLGGVAPRRARRRQRRDRRHSHGGGGT